MRAYLAGLLMLLSPSLGFAAVPASVGYVVPLELTKNDSLTGVCQSLIQDGIVTDALMQSWRKKIPGDTFDRPMYDGFSPKSGMHLCAAAAYLDHFGTLDGIDDARVVVREGDVYRFMVTPESHLSLQSFKDRVPRLEDALRVAHAQINDLLAKNEVLSGDLNSARYDGDMQALALERMQVEYSKLVTEKESLVGDLLAAKDQVRKLQTSIDNLHQENEHLKVAVTAGNEAANDRDVLSDELVGEIKRRTALQAELEQTHDKLTVAEEEIEARNKKLAYLSHQNDVLVTENELASKRAETLTATIRDLKGELAEIRADAGMFGSVFTGAVALKDTLADRWHVSEDDARRYVHYLAGASLLVIVLMLIFWMTRRSTMTGPATPLVAEPSDEFEKPHLVDTSDLERINELEGEVSRLRGELQAERVVVGQLQVDLDTFHAERRSGEYRVPITHIPGVSMVPNRAPFTVVRRIDRGSRNAPLLRYLIPQGLPDAYTWVPETQFIRYMRDTPDWCKNHGIEIEGLVTA